MKVVIVIKSYVGRWLEFGPIKIKPWFHAEVPIEDFKALSDVMLLEIDRAKKCREITLQMVADNKPVDQVNESLVLQMKAEADRASKSAEGATNWSSQYGHRFEAWII